MRILFILFFIVLVSGCATKVSQSNLYWGEYSNTLYEVKKNPGESSDRKHEEQLLHIVEKSKEKNLRVPPGIYAELGLYALERGDKETAKKYFELERETYPEGGALMQHALEFN